VELAGIDTMVGLFINTLPVRVRIDAGTPVAQWLSALQAQQAAARQYEYMPLVELQRWTDVPRGVLMFRSVLIFQNYPLKVSLSHGARSLTMLAGSSVERNSYPLTVVIEPGPRLLMRFVSDRRRFDEGTVERMIEQFRRLLANMCADPAQMLGNVSSGSATERARLIGGFNQSLA
jgi:non-ribosomal peptide synthetase component F